MNNVRITNFYLVVEILDFLLEESVLVLEIAQFSAEIADVVAHSLHFFALVVRLHRGSVRGALHLGDLRSKLS